MTTAKRWQSKQASDGGPNSGRASIRRGQAVIWQVSEGAERWDGKRWKKPSGGKASKGRGQAVGRQVFEGAG